jgi:hypothetical protein
MARPSIITDEFIAEFYNRLLICGSIETARKFTGFGGETCVGRETYYGWKRAVREGGGTAMQRKFMSAVRMAEAEIKLMGEHSLSKHLSKSWRAIAWGLERQYREEYGRKRLLPARADPDA